MQLNSLLFLQTRQEYQVLQGSIINAHYVKRGKTISSRKLRYHAVTVDASAVDYRSMGFVTEVKDQVGNNSIYPKWLNSSLQQTMFAGLLRFLLGLQHYGSHRGSVVQEDRSARIPEWAEPGGLLQVLRYLRLQWCLDGQCIRLRGQQRVTVDEHLPVHLSGKDVPGLPVLDSPLQQPAIT